MTLSLPRFAATAAATLVALCVVGAWPTHRAAGGDGLQAMGLAAGISFLGATLGLLPSLFASATPAARVQAALLGVGVRLFATLAAVFAVLTLRLTAAPTAFVVWIGLDYAAMLVLETLVVVRAARRGESVPA